jgi:hypothetical protein
MRVKQALLDPTSIFKEPQEVLLSQELTRDQKIQILRRWSYEIRELQVAEEENMQGKTQVDLQSVLNALRTLGAVVDLEHEPPTKQGGEEE